MDIVYTKVGDYYVPNLIFQGKKSARCFGKYGRLRLKYLKENHKDRYTILLMNDELTKHLESIDNEAEMMIKKLIKTMCINENITEKLKENDQMEWLKKINQFKNIAEEIVMKELIFV